MERATNPVCEEANSAKADFQARFRTHSSFPVLVTGATGLIGKSLVRRLLEQGQQIRVLVRREPSPEFMNDSRIDVFLGDLGDSAAVERAVAGAKTVYHVGAAMTGGAHDHERGTVAGTRNIVESVLKHGVQRLVYISSLSCLHAAIASETSQITESWPIEVAPQKRGFYTQAKTAAETIVRDAVTRRHLPAVILRPGRVFGPGAALITAEIARKVGNRFIVLGDGNRKLPMVYVEDVIDAIILASEKSNFDGSVFHIVDDEPITQNQLLEQYRENCAPNADVRHIPLPIIYTVAFALQFLGNVLRRSVPLTPYRLRSALAPMNFDCTQAHTQLGWSPRVGIRSGIRSTISAEVAETQLALPKSSGMTPWKQ
jgi:nucleoside-diphosphate-sugar epimerase